MDDKIKMLNAPGKNPEAFFYILPPWLLAGGALSALCLTALMLPVYKKIENREKTEPS